MLATSTSEWEILPLPKKFDKSQYTDARQVPIPLIWKSRHGTCLMENSRFVVTMTALHSKLAINDIILLQASGRRYGVWKITDFYIVGDKIKYLVDLILA